MGVLEGKTALVTGATRGIGRAIAEDFLRQGARVTVTGRGQEKGKLFLHEVAEIAVDEQAHFIAGDAGNQTDVEGAIAQTIGRYGHLDIMVINAGGPIPKLLADLTDREYERQVAFNLHQFTWAMRACVRHMAPRGAGRIIAISSAEGKMGTPSMAIYSACKPAVHGLVKSVAKEVGPAGVTVNGICPGVVITDAALELGPAVAQAMGLESPDELFAMLMSSSALNRTIEASECAALATFLASDASSGITGGVINVDGGMQPY
ncbi:MAG TPA: SDR family oxidoreductase [Pseudonocardia sp.]|jgi:NAD(P)-dependent dehydrogenase (short-subunit alcohol dehydrogenase family)